MHVMIIYLPPLLTKHLRLALKVAEVIDSPGDDLLQVSSAASNGEVLVASNPFCGIYI